MTATSDRHPNQHPPSKHLVKVETAESNSNTKASQTIHETKRIFHYGRLKQITNKENLFPAEVDLVFARNSTSKTLNSQSMPSTLIHYQSHFVRLIKYTWLAVLPFRY
jgi:hypothetical protein